MIHYDKLVRDKISSVNSMAAACAVDLLCERMPLRLLPAYIGVSGEKT